MRLTDHFRFYTNSKPVLYQPRKLRKSRKLGRCASLNTTIVYSERFHITEVVHGESIDKPHRVSRHRRAVSSPEPFEREYRCAEQAEIRLRLFARKLDITKAPSNALILCMLQRTATDLEDDA
jgi:hypothetical protein